MPADTYYRSGDEHRQDGDRVTRRCGRVRLIDRWMRRSRRWCLAKRATCTYHGDERVIRRNTAAPKRFRRSYRWWRRLASTSRHGMLCRPQLWMHSWRHVPWHYPAPPPSRSHKCPTAQSSRGCLDTGAVERPAPRSVFPNPPVDKEDERKKAHEKEDDPYHSSTSDGGGYSIDFIIQTVITGGRAVARMPSTPPSGKG